MKKLKYLPLLAVINIGLNAQILECRALDDMSVGVQVAKYKFDQLKSANGTIYNRAGVNYKYNFTIFTAITELGIENIGLYNNSEHIDGVEFYKATTAVEYKNGMTKKMDLLCYDLIQMNKQRINKGIKPSEIMVLDY